MSNELKLKWVEALRSGNYEQGLGSLCNHSSFCCLGVYHDVISGEWIKHNKDEDGDEMYDLWVAPCRADSNSCGVDYHDGGLCKVTLTELGFTGDDQSALISLNDTYEVPFSEIANVIEEHVQTGTSIVDLVEANYY